MAIGHIVTLHDVRISSLRVLHDMHLRVAAALAAQAQKQAVRCASRKLRCLNSATSSWALHIR